MNTPHAPSTPEDLPTHRLLQSLPREGAPAQLFVLLHGVGASADDLVPLAQVLRDEFPQAAILLPDGFEVFDAAPTAQGRQWFSIVGVTEDNRPARVAAAVPQLIEWVRAQQQRLGIGSAATALIGFSQGSIMALEASHVAPDLAGRVLAFAGRYATLPQAVSPHVTYHFFHGSADPVIAASHAREALEHLSQLEGGDATLDIAEGVGHELHEALLDRALFRLTHHIPRRLWQEAMGASAATSASLSSTNDPTGQH